MNKKLFVFLGALILGTLVLAACATPAGPMVATDTHDYIAPMLKYREVGESIGGMVVASAIALVLGVGAFLITLFSGRDERNAPGVGIVVGVLLAVLWFGGSAVKASYVQVDSGDIGVVINQGKAMRSIEGGQHWVTPWVEKVALYPKRVITVITVDDPNAQGSEQYRTFPQTVTSSNTVQGKVHWQAQVMIDPAKIMTLYEQYGTLDNAIAQLIKNPILPKVRDLMRGKTAEEIVTGIDLLNAPMNQHIVERARPGGLIVIEFSFRRPSFGDWEASKHATAVAAQNALKAAEEAKVVEAQQKAEVYKAETAAQVLQLQAEAKAKANVTQAEADAKIASTAAQGAADAAKIKADADAYVKTTTATAEAKANKEVASSVTATLIEYMKWNKWDGKLPQIVSDLAGLFVQTPTPAK